MSLSCNKCILNDETLTYLWTVSPEILQKEQTQCVKCHKQRLADLPVQKPPNLYENSLLQYQNAIKLARLCSSCLGKLPTTRKSYFKALREQLLSKKNMIDTNIKQQDKELKKILNEKSKNISQQKRLNKDLIQLKARERENNLLWTKWETCLENCILECQKQKFDCTPLLNALTEAKLS